MPLHSVNHQYHEFVSVPQPPPSLQSSPVTVVAGPSAVYLASQQSVPNVPIGSSVVPSVGIANVGSSHVPMRSDPYVAESSDGYCMVDQGQYRVHYPQVQQVQGHTHCVSQRVSTTGSSSAPLLGHPSSSDPTSTSFNTSGNMVPTAVNPISMSKCDVGSDQPAYGFLQQARGTGQFVVPVAAVQLPPPTTVPPE